MWEQGQMYMHSQQQQTMRRGMIGTERMHLQQQPANTTNLPVASNPRASRNLAEKQRRDNLNRHISKMATLIPNTGEIPKRMDKISILRLSANSLRLEYTLGRGTPNFLPPELGDLDLEQYIIDNFFESGSFFFVLTTAGKIVYASRQIQEVLGYTQLEILGMPFFKYVHKNDHQTLMKNLKPDEPHEIVSSSTQITNGTNDNSNSSVESATTSNDRKLLGDQRRYFELMLAHRPASKNSEHNEYEIFEISGVFRLAEACKNPEARTRNREMAVTNNDVLFVGIARSKMRRPPTRITFMEANKSEYITRHLVDGRIIFCDQRVSVVAGYLSEEVSGRCAFTFMHDDERLYAMAALRHMYKHNNSCGSSCYRLKVKAGEQIFLRTHGYLEIENCSRTAISLVCINTVVTAEEGWKLIKQMKDRFSAKVTENSSKEEIEEAERAEKKIQAAKHCDLEKDAEQVEEAVSLLVNNLQKRGIEHTCSTMFHSTEVFPVDQFDIVRTVSKRLPTPCLQAKRLGLNTDVPDCDSVEVVEHKPLNTSSSKYRGKSSAKPKNFKTSNTFSQVGNVQSKQSSLETNNTIAKELPAEPRVNTLRNSRRSHLETHRTALSPTSSSETPVTTDANLCTLREDNQCDVKVERNTEDYKQENGISEIHPHPLKRICSDEDISSSYTKKRHNGCYASSDTSEEQNFSYEYTSFVNEELSELSTDFNQYNINPQSLEIAESPNSTSNQGIADYQQVDTSVPFVSPNPDDDAFIDLQDLREDTLLSPAIDANQELIMKIFDDLRHVSIFKNCNNTKMQQLTDDAINAELTRQHLQLGDVLARQQSEINVLMNNPHMQGRSTSFTQVNTLQEEHNRQQQILETLQHDHHNMQRNMRYNIGV